MNTWGFFVPGWFLVMVCLVFAALPWIEWFKRFSLRTMFVVTTVIALVLGMLTYFAGQ